MRTPESRLAFLASSRAGMVIVAALGWQSAATADESEAELAQQLANPVSALISVPFQLNYNSNIGPADDGEQWLLNAQPVIPFSLNKDWNLISRTILPLVHQSDVFPGAGNQTGLGDTVQTLFFSPKAPAAGGWIWGAGPVFLVPTGTDDLLTTDKWGAGPSAVLLRQTGPWTTGMLGNHIWSYAGDSNRRDVSSSLLQPFVSYTTPGAWTFGLQTESTYDWEGNGWQIPIRGTFSKLTRVGTQLVSLGGGVHYWVESTPTGPEGWGLRLTMTLLFPR